MRGSFSNFERWVRLSLADGNVIFLLLAGGDPRNPRDFTPARRGSGADRSCELLAALYGAQLEEVCHAAA